METLWSQLGKREKELNRSKIGARDLSHSVKSMRAALEKTREDSKAAWDKVENLQVKRGWFDGVQGMVCCVL